MSDQRTYTPSEKAVHALETVGAALAVANARDRGYIVAGLRRLIGNPSVSRDTDKAPKVPAKNPNSLRSLEKESDEWKHRQACLAEIKTETEKLGVLKLDDNHPLLAKLREADKALVAKREALRVAAGKKPAAQEVGPKPAPKAKVPSGPITRAQAAAEAAAKGPGSPKATATSSKSQASSFKSAASTATGSGAKPSG